jgi:hypothetical protein
MDAYDKAFPDEMFVPDYGPPRDYFTPNEDGALGGRALVVDGEAAARRR